MKRRRLLGYALGAAAVGTAGVSLAAGTGAFAASALGRPFPSTDPFNTPVTNPQIDPNSPAMIEALLGGSEPAPVVDLTHFGASINVADSSTPRYTVVPSYSDEWGGNPFEGRTIPWDESWHIPPGDSGWVDGWALVLDGDTSFELWQTEFRNGELTCSFGDITNVSTSDGSSNTVVGAGTGADFSCLAGRITAAEWRTGVVDHALSFGCELSDSTHVYPATSSDGGNKPTSTTFPEGTRVWLDSAYDIDADANLRDFERIIAKAVQQYGAYCGDNAGAFSFGAEYAADATADDPGSAARSVGITADYPRLDNVPWSQYLRVLLPER